MKYNQGGLLEQGIDARGVTTTFDYDGLNRIEEVIYSDGTPRVKYYYDQARTGFHNKGALTKVETVRETSTPADIFATSAEFDYDLMGRLRKHRQWINSQQYDLEYDYNLAGQMTSEKYPSGKIVTTSYDANGRMSGLADSQRTYLSGMQYQGKGNSLSQMSLGNGTTESFTLNDRFQMEEQQLKKGSDVLQKYVYGYGQVDVNGVLHTGQNNGQLGTIESWIGGNKQATQKFRYDHIGRLKESAEYRGDNGNLTYKQVFDFDRFGNLYRKAANNPTAGQQNPLNYEPIEDGQISKTTNRFTSNTTYDEAGQVVNDAKFRTMSFAYAANGRQVKATRANVPDAWTVYDASGNRVAQKINNIWRYMIYDAAGKLVAEYGEKSDGTGGVKYVQQDWQGSVRTTTNNNGFVTARTDHQAFSGDVGYGTGQRSIEQGYNVDKATRQGYGLTERDDATGQDHTWFRKNENQAGRWTSPDPYNGSSSVSSPQSWNKYSYVQNDPVNYIDPSGLNMWSGFGGGCGPSDPMGIAYYVDGMLTTACHAWAHLNGGGGYISWHSVVGFMGYDHFTLLNDSWVRTGQSYFFTNYGGTTGVEGRVVAGGRTDGESASPDENDWSKCTKEAYANLKGRIGAALNNFGKVVGKHFNPTTVGGIVMIFASALHGNAIGVLGGAVTALAGMANNGVNIASGHFATERLIRKASQAGGNYLKDLYFCEQEYGSKTPATTPFVGPRI